MRRLLLLAAEQHGYITTADAREVGLTAMALVMADERGTLERVGYGLYRVPELAGDPLARHQEALLRIPHGALTRETALELHDLADVNPHDIQVAIAKGIRVRRALPAWIELSRGDFPLRDITYEHGLAVVTPARAIIEATHAGTANRFVDQAIANATRRNLLSTEDRRAINETLALQMRTSDLPAMRIDAV